MSLTLIPGHCRYPPVESSIVRPRDSRRRAGGVIIASSPSLTLRSSPPLAFEKPGEHCPVDEQLGGARRGTPALKSFADHIERTYQGIRDLWYGYAMYARREALGGGEDCKENAEDVLRAPEEKRAWTAS